MSRANRTGERTPLGVRSAQARSGATEGSRARRLRIPHSPPEKPTSFDLSVFQLSAPFGAWSLLRKWSCPADSEVSAEVSGALNFTLRKAQNITMAIAITSHRQSRYFTKTVRVRIHTQTHRKYIFYSAYTKQKGTYGCFFVLLIEAGFEPVGSELTSGGCK